MFYSSKLSKFENIKHCFFSRENGSSKGIYKSLNCDLGSNDNKENAKSFPAGCASACSHKKSGKVDWYLENYYARDLAEKMYEKYYKNCA